MITFLTYFLKIYDLQGKVAIASPGSWFHNLIVLLQRRIYQYLFIVSWP